MNYQKKYLKYKQKYLQLKNGQSGNGKYSCRTNLAGISKISDICISGPTGKYDDLNKCVFSDECLQKFQEDNRATKTHVITSTHSTSIPTQYTPITKPSAPIPMPIETTPTQYIPITKPSAPIPMPIVKENYRTDINSEDILYQDDDVCILKPDVKKGVLLFTKYSNINACEIGLKTGEQLQREGVDFGRSIYHPYIFFRAPYYGTGVDYSTIETEINSSFGDIEKNKIAFIRVDPLQTFVYSSEMRIHTYSVTGSTHTPELLSSRKLLMKYLEIITENDKKLKDLKPGFGPVYNLVSSQLSHGVPWDNYSNIKYPFDIYPTNKTSEVLVRIPHMTTEYFVKCHYI